MLTTTMKAHDQYVRACVLVPTTSRRTHCHHQLCVPSALLELHKQASGKQGSHGIPGYGIHASRASREDTRIGALLLFPWGTQGRLLTV